MEALENKKKGYSFSEIVQKKARRKLNALKEKKGSAWMGLGMFGMVGWSVTIPTLLGIGLGIWLDKRHPISFSWTLSLLILGLVIGCLLAWNWVIKDD